MINELYYFKGCQMYHRLTVGIFNNAIYRQFENTN